MEYDYPYEHDTSDPDVSITGNPREAFEQLRCRMRVLLRESPKKLKQALAEYR